jgi:predicted DNA-binding transcriptional regulator AlpA
MTQKLMTAASVREALGGVSDMTMWRWLNEPTMKFPQPIYINRRRYWREGQIVDWLQGRQQEAVAAE